MHVHWGRGVFLHVRMHVHRGRGVFLRRMLSRDLRDDDLRRPLLSARRPTYWSLGLLQPRLGGRSWGIWRDALALLRTGSWVRYVLLRFLVSRLRLCLRGCEGLLTVWRVWIGTLGVHLVRRRRLVLMRVPRLLRPRMVCWSVGIHGMLHVWRLAVHLLLRGVAHRLLVVHVVWTHAGIHGHELLGWVHLIARIPGLRCFIGSHCKQFLELVEAHLSDSQRTCVT